MAYFEGVLYSVLSLPQIELLIDLIVIVIVNLQLD